VLPGVRHTLGYAVRCHTQCLKHPHSDIGAFEQRLASDQRAGKAAMTARTFDKQVMGHWLTSLLVDDPPSGRRA